MPTLNMKQGDDLTREVSKMLVTELESDSIKKKVDKIVSDYVARGIGIRLLGSFPDCMPNHKGLSFSTVTHSQLFIISTP